MNALSWWEDPLQALMLVCLVRRKEVLKAELEHTSLLNGGLHVKFFSSIKETKHHEIKWWKRRNAQVQPSSDNCSG